MSKKVKRLYEQFIPDNYNLSIKIDEPNMTFAGKVIITGKKSGRPSERITFHQKDLKITSAKVTKTDKNGTHNLEVKRINHHKSYDEVRLHFDQTIYPGQYQIELEFLGKITDGFTGLYPCYYQHKRKKKILFSTQFESHHAREAFPCIDEPEAKATFDLSVTAPKINTTISNMEVKSTKASGDLTTTTFETTPIMSAYLLAWATGEIHYVEGKSKSGVRVRSYSTVAHPKERLEFSRDEAVKTLEFFEDYFQTPFPLKKIDHIAVPDFEVGAMENWGMIAYRESVFIYDPKNPSLPLQKRIAMVIAHELSHQWFGNLVTMKWWDDLWLNESFASIMEHLPLDKNHPDWHQWEEYSAYDIPHCSNRDVYADVQHVGVNVNHPDEIHTLFDTAIVYAKGGRLIKMLREYIGDDALRLALKNYFQKHAYKNTYRDDLWAEMSEASGQDIKALMTPWLEQSGLPVLKVEKDSKTGKRTISQSRFILDKDSSDEIWPVPLLSNDTELEILDKKSVEIPEDSLPLINPNGSGHYIVHYTDPDDQAEIIKRITSDRKHALSRINTLNDLILLAKRGDNSLVDSLKLVEKMPDETSDNVWALMTRATSLASALGEFDDDVEEGLKKFRYNLAHKNYQKLGWDDQNDDDASTKDLRATMIGLMIASEDKDILEKAKNVYESAKDIEDIPSDRLGLVLHTMVKHFGDQKLADKLIEIYNNTNNPRIKSAIQSSLTSTKSTDIAKQIFADGLSIKGYVKPQDFGFWFAYFMRNKYTRETTWNWLVNSWDTTIQKLFGASKSIDDYVIYSAGPMQTKQWQEKFINFYEPMINDPALARNIKIAKSEISARIDWRDRELPNLRKFFKNF